MSESRTYVLVHGGFAGGWSWSRLAPLLRDAGHRVFAPTLSGSADRSHIRTVDTGLSTHVTDVVELLKWENLSDVILVGHSYGGMVITGVADRALDRIAHLVYLDAAHPSNGEALVDVAPLSMQYAGMTRRIIDGVEVVGGIPFEQNRLAAADALPVLEPDPTPEELQAWVDGHDTPFPWRAFEEKLTLQNESAVRALPRTSINTTESLNREPESDAARRRLHADQVWEVDTTHNLQVTEPRQVADLLLRLARSPQHNITAEPRAI